MLLIKTNTQKTISILLTLLSIAIFFFAIHSSAPTFGQESFKEESKIIRSEVREEKIDKKSVKEKEEKKISSLIPQNQKEGVIIQSVKGKNNNDVTNFVLPKNDQVPKEFLTTKNNALSASYIYLRTSQSFLDVPENVPYLSLEESSPLFSFINQSQEVGLTIIAKTVDETDDRFRVTLREELDGIPVMGQQVSLVIAKKSGKIISMHGKLDPVFKDAEQTNILPLDKIQQKLIGKWKSLGYIFSNKQDPFLSAQALYYTPKNSSKTSVRLGYQFATELTKPFGVWEVFLDAQTLDVISSRNTALMQEEKTLSGSGSMLANPDQEDLGEVEEKKPDLEVITIIPAEENNGVTDSDTTEDQDRLEAIFQTIISGNIVEGITNVTDFFSVPFANVKVVLEDNEVVYTDQSGGLTNIDSTAMKQIELSSPHFSIIDDDIAVNQPVTLSLSGLLTGSGSIISTGSGSLTGSGNILSLFASNVIPLLDSTAFYYTEKAFNYVEQVLNVALPTITFHTNSYLADSNNESCRAFYLPWKNEIHTGRCQGGATNLALFQSTIFHELGHSFVENLEPFVAYNDEVRLMREGISDFFATTMTNYIKNTSTDYYDIDSDITADCSKTLSYFASLEEDNDQVYTGSCSIDNPDHTSDLVGKPHADGHIISSILWDVSETLGLEETTKLLFAALQNETGSLDMLLYNMLLENDVTLFGGDNDLTTGTPHDKLLFDTFFKHGIGPGYDGWLVNSFEPESPEPTAMPKEILYSIPTNGLVGYWQMDNDWTDASGNGNNGTANNGATFTSSGRIDQGGSFDGTDDYTNVPHSATLDVTADDFSMIFWIKLLGYSSTGSVWDSILSKGIATPAPSNFMGFFINSDYKVYFLYYDAYNGRLISSYAVNDDWHHVAGIKDGNIMRLYIDGVPSGSRSISTSFSNTEDILLGNDGHASRYFNGDLDEVAIYNRVLSATEVELIAGCSLDRYLDTGACVDGTNGQYSPLIDNNVYTCTNKPTYSSYTGTGSGENNCPYTCDTGYSGVNCTDTTPPTPNPSTGLITVNSTSSITWDIDAAADSGSGLHTTPYSFTNGSSWQAGNTLLENSLTSNTQYTKNIVARDTDGNQTTAGTLSAYTFSDSPTGATFDGNGWQASPSGYYIDLSWSSGGNQTGYKVYRSDDSYTTPLYTGTSTSFQDTGFGSNESYTYHIYSYNGDSINSSGYTSIAGDTNISLSISISAGDTIDFGSLTFDTLYNNAESVVSVSTNAANGYNLFVQDDQVGSNSALYNSDDTVYISDYAGTITTPTSWTGNGFGMCVYSGTDKNVKWGTGTTPTDSNNKYAGIPQNTTEIHSKTGYSATANTTNVSYGIQASTNQIAGDYAGTITYSVVAQP